MKNTLRLLPFVLFIVAAFAFAFALTLPAFAQTVVDSTQPAQVVAVEETSATTLVSIAIALITGLLAIWQKKEASTAKKITASIVLGVEQATKLPQVQEQERRIKGMIRAHAENLGVEPLLQRVVKDLT